MLILSFKFNLNIAKYIYKNLKNFKYNRDKNLAKSQKNLIYEKLNFTYIDNCLLEIIETNNN